MTTVRANRYSSSKTCGLVVVRAYCSIRVRGSGILPWLFDFVGIFKAIPPQALYLA